MIRSHSRSLTFVAALGGVLAFSAPLSAQDEVAGAAPTVAMVEKSMTASGLTSRRLMSQGMSAADPSALAQAPIAQSAPHFLRWNKEFDGVQGGTQGQPATTRSAGLVRSFDLSTVGPDFGKHEAVDQKFDLGNSLTLEPRAVVSRRVGQEFEQTYANGASTTSDALLDGAVTAVGRVGTVRLRL
mgnify:FL=1